MRMFLIEYKYKHMANAYFMETNQQECVIFNTVHWAKGHFDTLTQFQYVEK